jgi:hypothetical protein
MHRRFRARRFEGRGSLVFWTAAGTRTILIGTNKELNMPGNPRDMIVSAETRFPVRIRIGVPPGRFGQRYAEITGSLFRILNTPSVVSIL